MASEIKVTNIKANDGTASLTIADSTGAITEVKTGTIRAADGTAGMTIANSTGAITASGGIANAGTITAGTLGALVALPSFQGMIAPFAMTTPPTGWLACDGSAVSRTTYATLFTAISTTWGVGDGSSTFNLPDLEGAFLRGTGSNATHNMADGNDFAGPSVGSFENDQVQSHGHVIRVHSAGASGFVSVGYMSSPQTPSGQVTDLTESSAGPPRGGDETRPFNAGVKYCIKY